MKRIAARKTFFKSNANVAHNEVNRYWAQASYVDAKYKKASGNKKLCPACNGTGCYTVTQVRTVNGWAWQSSNLPLYDNPVVVAQWNEIEPCGTCYGSGYTGY